MTPTARPADAIPSPDRLLAAVPGGTVGEADRPRTRPPVPFMLRDGLAWHAEPDPSFTTDPAVIGGFRCRRAGWHGRDRCPNDAVAALMRSAYRYREPMDLSGERKVPWRYCLDHLYGRWIEDGQVFHWTAKEVG